MVQLLLGKCLTVIKPCLAEQYNHGFAVDWMRKDLDICLAEAQKNGAQLPITAIGKSILCRCTRLRWRSLGYL
jgi:3-hydroxyisobutyrate dehydrogenase-like beta-hydroxyacid dehydrogenase